MTSRLVIKDGKGALIKLFICLIIWYIEVLEYKYLRINNLLLVLGVLETLAVLLDYSSQQKEGFHFFFPNSIKILLAYIFLVMVFGLVVSPNISSHISHGITIIEFALIMLYILYFGETRGNIDFLIWNYAIMYTFMCFAFLRSPEIYHGTYGEGIRYSFSPDVNPNGFSMGLTIGCWSLLYLASNKKIPNSLAMALSIIFAYATIATGSKTGIIGIGICILMWVVLCYLPLNEKKTAAKTIGRIVLLVLAGYGIIRFFLPTFYNSLLFARLTGMARDASTLQRLDMYEKGYEYLKSSPILGYGFWGFAYFHHGLYSHSTIVETFVSGGIPLGILYFSSYIDIFRNQIKQSKTVKYYTDSHRKYVTLVLSRMGIILFVVFLFYTICVIHIYEFASFCEVGIMAFLYTNKVRED